MAKVYFKIDYATINFALGSIDKDILTGILCPDTDFLWRRAGRNEGSPWISPLGVSWLDNNGYDKFPHRVQISGSGCSHFAETMFQLRQFESKCSRIDFAFDVIIKREEWANFLCNAFNKSINQTSARKKFVLSGSGHAMTVYIGSRKCAKFCRIYNKSLEDKEYKLVDESGNVIDIPDDSYIVRYEVELKHFKGRGQDFDPTPYFDMYYNKEYWSELNVFLHDIWSAYTNDILLPDDFESFEFQPNLTEELFCSNSSPVPNPNKVKDQLHEFPRSFERTLIYVTEKFGKYIPYILATESYRKEAFRNCEIAFGFMPDFVIEKSEPGYYEEYDILDDPWSIEEYDQDYIENFI